MERRLAAILAADVVGYTDLETHILPGLPPPPLPRTQEAHQRPALGPGEAFWRGFLNRPLSSAGEQEAGPDPTQLASAER